MSSLRLSSTPASNAAGHLPAANVDTPATTPSSRPPAASRDVEAPLDPNAPPLPDLQMAQSWSPTAIWRLLASTMVRQQQILSHMHVCSTLRQAQHNFAAAQQQRASVVGDRKSTTVSLMGSISGSVVGLVCSSLGSWLGFVPQSNLAAVSGTLFSGIGQVAQSMSNTLTQCLDANVSALGGKYASEQARIQKAVLDNFSQLERGNEQTQQAAVEATKRSFSAIEEMIKGTQEQDSQMRQTIGRNI